MRFKRDGEVEGTAVCQPMLFQLGSPETKLKLFRSSLNLLIYGSVILGIILLVQVYSIVPWSLFSALTAGWVAYCLVAIAAVAGRGFAYPSALILSVLTLVASVPQPEHYSLLQAGVTLPSLTLITGSAVQIAIITTSLIYLFLKRKDSKETMSKRAS